MYTSKIYNIIIYLIILLVFLNSLFYPLSAQINEGGTPISFLDSNGYLKPKQLIHTCVMPTVNSNLLMLQFFVLIRVCLYT